GAVAGAAVRRPGAGGRGRGVTVRRARTRVAGAALRHVALPRRGAADRRRRLVPVDAVAVAVARVGAVARAAVRRPAAGGRGRGGRVLRTRPRATGAALRHVALPRRRSADRRRRLVAVDAVAVAVARVGAVAGAAVRSAGAGGRGRGVTIRRARARVTGAT